MKEPITYPIGLALSGGASKGFAHLGVLKALEEREFYPQIIAGTSSGALMGVLYADGYNPSEIIDLFKGTAFTGFTEWQIPQSGVFSTSGFKRFLNSVLRHKNLEELSIPVRVVATDLDNGNSVVFDHGPIVPIVTASCSVPVIFNPVIINGINYVDGGLFKNFPASIIRDDCDFLIGVHVNPKPPVKYKKNLINVALRSYEYIFRANAIPDRDLCDLLIESNVFAKVKTFDTSSAQEIAQIGYDLAHQALKSIGKKNKE